MESLQKQIYSSHNTLVATPDNLISNLNKLNCLLINKQTWKDELGMCELTLGLVFHLGGVGSLR